MALSDIVTVNISSNTATPTRVGFGTIMLAAYHTLNTDRVRSYTSLAAMVADGFSATAGAATNAAYKAAAAMFSQNPTVTRIKVGRRSTAYTQVVDLTPTSFVAGLVYTLTVTSTFGVTTIAYTVPGSSSVAAICAAMTTLINANTQVTCVNNSTKMTVTTGTAGIIVGYTGLNPELQIKDQTTDPGIAADLAAILAADTDWYGVALDSNSKAEIVAAAAWIEANNKVMAVTTQDTEVGTGSTTDVMSTLQTSSYFRTCCFYNSKSNQSYTGPALLAHEFPFDPGTRTFAYKTLAGVPTDVISDSVATAIYGKGGNTYTSILGIPITQKGRVSGGEWLDVIVGKDWLQQRIKERVYGLLIANGKIPFTDSGIAKIETELKAQLTQAVNVGFLSGDTPPVVIVPTAASVDSTSKGLRTLPGVTFSATLAGAIHVTTITGTISN